jgi:hypothetical protein
MSTVRVENPAGYSVFDEESRLSFTLPEDSYVLIIYNASNRHGSPEARLGKRFYIVIDDEYQPEYLCQQSTYTNNIANSVTCTWAGRLQAGAHNVVAEVSGVMGAHPVGVDVRQMIVLAAPVSSGPLIHGVSATQTLCPSFGHSTADPHSRLFFNLNDEANVLVIYDVGKEYYPQTPTSLPTALIYIDGLFIPESKYFQHIHDLRDAFGVTCTAFSKLGVGIHSISGMIEGACISKSTIAYVVAPKPWASAGIMSSNIITGSQDTMGSPPPWDDPDSIVTVDLAEDSLCLAVYNTEIFSQVVEGGFTMINIDGVDMEESFAAQSGGASSYNQILSMWAGRLTAGTHTIKGRWGTSNPAGSASLWNRTIAVICIPESLLI